MVTSNNNKSTLVAKEGLPFIIGFSLVGAVLTAIPNVAVTIIGLLCLVFAAFCAFFFRDPQRTIPVDPSFILAPGDGRILEICEEPSPYWNGKAKVVKIFLSVFNVHIQRSPVGGTVIQTKYQAGKFLDARNPRACFENENHAIIIENSQGKIVVKQIAGFIARRIVSWVQAGQNVAIGQRLGLIRFGSQVDLFLPEEVEICVSKGDPVVGGISVVAFNKK